MDALQETPDPGLKLEFQNIFTVEQLEPIPFTNLYNIPPYPGPLLEDEDAHPMAQLAPQPEMDFAARKRQKVLNGIAIFEMAIKRHEEKEEADRLIDAAEKLGKCNKFVVQRMDLSLEGEVLGTRLQEGTNRKRARTINLQYLNHYIYLLDLSNTQSPDNLRSTRCHSEEVKNEVCARTRALQFLGDTAPRLEEGHNSNDMSERSSGTKRRTRSSGALTSESSADRLTSATTSGTFEEVVGKSADNNEVVPIRGSSKRIRPNKGPTVVEEEAKAKELEPAVSPEKVLDALPTPYADDTKAATASSASSKRKSWPAYNRYLDPGKSVLADYGPCASFPNPPERADKEMPKPTAGGMKPVNRLAVASKQNPNPPFKQQRPGVPKAFDLTGDTSYSHQYNENPAKRQRIGNGSPTSAIDVDEPLSAQIEYGRPTSSARSGHSQTLQSYGTSARHEARVSSSQEFRNVQHSMKPPSVRNRNGKPSVISDPQRFSRNTLGQHVGEDENDLISDDGSSSKNGTTGKSSKKTELLTSGYQGTANRVPSRQLANGTSRISNRPRAETAEISPHFGANQGRVRNIHDLLSRDDQDELATDPGGKMHHADIAQGLLEKSWSGKPVPLKTKGLPIDVEDLSEDEINNADILPGQYGTSKTKIKQHHETESFTVHQAFSETHKWLLKDALSFWSLKLAKSAKLLFLHDDSDQLVFEIPTKEFGIIEIAKKGRLMVFHKSRTSTAAGATKIYIEMHSLDDCQQLIEGLKSLEPTIAPSYKDLDNTRKIFEHIAQKAVPSKRPREPDDLRLIKFNADRKFADQCASAQSSKKANAGTIGARQQNGTLQKGTQAKGLAKGMRRGSQSSEILDVDDNRRTSNATALLPGDFYGASRDSRLNGGDHGTRSSKKITSHEDISPVSRQSLRQRMRSPSPDPERWTFQNPDWVEQEKWETSVIYPPDGKNKASVDMQDIQRLDEGEFLNDNLIVFYLRWLEDRLVKDNPELASRIYFTNTFFYERLTKNSKGKSGGINYEAVERWTSKIDLLKYDYIVVPVNETVHWYVAIICNAPKLLKQPSSGEEASQEIENEDLEDKAGEAEVEGQSISSPLNTPAKSQSDVVVPRLKGMTLEDNINVAPDSDVPASNPDAHVAADAQKTAQIVNLDPPTTNVVSDMTEQKPPQAKKKGNRKSLTTVRKYNPDDPRIITLDSLGLTHSPTCTNLRKYLLREIKAKKNIEIEDPGPLGTSAKHIPQQNNHCDCGLFLLTYIEEFLKKPDDFIRDILQQNDQDFTEWRSASDMRKHIRELLFELQRDQIREADKLKKEKCKKKQAVKSGDKLASAASSKPASREASRSIGGSASPEKAQPLPDTTQSHQDKSQKRQEGPPGPSGLPQHLSVVAPSKGEPPKSSVINPHDGEVREDTRGTSNLLTRFVAKAQSTINHALGLGENGLPGARPPEVRASESQPITIDDSQDLDQETHHLAAPVSGRKGRKRKPSQAPSPEDSRDSKLPRLQESIEILESPKQEFAEKGPRIKDSAEEMFLTSHPSLYSNQGEDQDQYQSAQLSKRPVNYGNHRVSKTKTTDAPSHEDAAPEVNELEAVDYNPSQDDVQLVDVRPTSLRNGVIARRQEQDDDDNKMLLEDSPPPSGLPPPDAPLLSSSPGGSFSVPEVAAKDEPRGRVVRSSPRGQKRRSSSSVAIELLSSKKRTSYVDLSDGQSPKAKRRDDFIEPGLLDASDMAIIGDRGTHRRLSRGSFR